MSECHHGWRGAPIETLIQTRCPTCAGQMFIGDGGLLTCAVLRCPKPDVGEEIVIMKRKLKAIEALHRRQSPIDSTPERTIADYCAYCATQWPCPTSAIINSEGEQP